MVKIGERIGVIMYARDNVVSFAGYGVYMGRGVPPDADMWPTPELKMDNGDTLWGHQCWWGKEEEIKERIEKYKELGWEIEED